MDRLSSSRGGVIGRAAVGSGLPWNSRLVKTFAARAPLPVAGRHVSATPPLGKGSGTPRYDPLVEQARRAKAALRGEPILAILGRSLPGPHRRAFPRAQTVAPVASSGADRRDWTTRPVTPSSPPFAHPGDTSPTRREAARPVDAVQW